MEDQSSSCANPRVTESRLPADTPTLRRSRTSPPPTRARPPGEGVDFYALSFVREAAAIHDLRAHLEAHQSTTRIIAKMEDQQAIANLEEIIDASEGGMVARGDLGIECP